MKVSRASENENPLALFSKVERTRRRARRAHREKPVAHLRYGRFDPEIERSLEIERPDISDPDEAELERLLTKHSDIAHG